MAAYDGKPPLHQGRATSGVHDRGGRSPFQHAPWREATFPSRTRYSLRQNARSLQVLAHARSAPAAEAVRQADRQSATRIAPGARPILHARRGKAAVGHPAVHKALAHEHRLAPLPARQNLSWRLVPNQGPAGGTIPLNTLGAVWVPLEQTQRGTETVYRVGIRRTLNCLLANTSSSIQSPC